MKAISSLVYKIIYIVAFSIVLVSTSGCLGVSQTEYEELLRDNNKMESELIRLESEIHRVNSELSVSQSELEEKTNEITSLGNDKTRLQEQLDKYIAESTDLQKQIVEYQATITELEAQIDKYTVQLYDIPPADRTISDCVQPGHPAIRDHALKILKTRPLEIDMYDEAWRIWSIFWWVSNEINYVYDPLGQEYFAYAHETLESGAGDCDDFAILLASLYEAVGIDAGIAYVDTDGNSRSDHMACLVYWSGTAQDFIDQEERFFYNRGYYDPFEFIFAKYYLSKTSGRIVFKKYSEGIWIVADATMSYIKGLIGYITHEPYEYTEIIDVGN